MKSILLRIGLLVCLVFLGWSYQGASAATTWQSKCTDSFGEVIPNQNPSPQHINCLLTNAALEAKIPPEVVKAVAKQESGWRQYKDGKPYISDDNGIGIMQITNQSVYDEQKLKDDIYYNIQAGVDILNSMYKRGDLPKINEVGKEVIESWYFPVMAYNGTKPVNSPLYKSNGLINEDAYQEMVFSKIEEDSFLVKKYTLLGKFPFKTADFDYDRNNDDNIIFLEKEYTLTDQMHPSNYLFQKGNKVVVTQDNVKLRSQPSTSSNYSTLANNTTLIITGNFEFDQNKESMNQFVWYPVKIENSIETGYISSAYISKRIDPPKVNPVDDHATSISGKALANAPIQIMNGSNVIASPVADKDGNFNAKISVQKAGTKLSITYKDELNATSLATTITVADKTPPLAPQVNTVTNKMDAVTGKTEAKATVMVTISGKTYSAIADGSGNYKVGIPVQNTGLSITVTAKDVAGNVGPSKTVKVVRAAPNMPSVNAVNNKATTVTGKTEAKATVTVTIAGKSYSIKADSSGNYKVAIPVQNTGTSISVKAKDSAGNVSSARTVKVVRVAPNMPSVNTVNNKATTVTGKTEAKATVIVTIAGKTYSAKADGSGNYKVSIPIQNSGKSISVKAKDAAGNVSVAKSITVTRVAPNMPTVNKVRYTSTSVTGKTEKNATVAIKIGNKTYTAKANAKGDYKVQIPKQKAGTKLSVSAKDAKGKVSATRSVTVSK